MGPGHAHPRAAGPGPGCPPLDPHKPAAATTSTSRSSTTASRSTPFRGSKASGSVALARRRIGWATAGGSRSTARSPSIRTAGSCRRAAPMGSGSSAKPSSSCETTPAPVRSRARGPRSWRREEARLQACCSSSGTARDGRAAQRTSLEEGRQDTGAAPRGGQGDLRGERLPRGSDLRHRRARRPVARVLLPLLRVEGRDLPRGRRCARGAAQRALRRRQRPGRFVLRRHHVGAAAGVQPPVSGGLPRTRPGSWG